MAMQAKLDELIRATQEARNILIDVENTSDAEIREAKMDLAKLSKE